MTPGKIAANAVGTTQIAAGAVGSGQLANNAVTEAKIAGNAVTSGKIADNSVTEAKIANGAVTAGKVTINVRSENTPIAKEAVGLASAECLSGEKLIGIGEAWSPPSPLNSIEAQFYLGTFAFVRAHNGTNAANSITVQAVCLG